VTPERIASEAPAFVRAMHNRKLKVEFATTGFSPEMLAADDTPLRVMADLGVKSFRMAYFSYTEREDLFAQLDRARAQMHRMAELCRKFRIKAVYQIHHGDKMLVHHSLAALHIVRDLPDEYVGIMPDPGNQFHEGLDNWRRAILTLGKYTAAIGVKDAAIRFEPEGREQPHKGWKKVWAPCHEGVTNWHVIARALNEIRFRGVLNFQPFYHTDRLDLLISTLRQEVAYIRKTMNETEGASD
jgi:sugar phosphate isomerase/epimerase